MIRPLPSAIVLTFVVGWTTTCVARGPNPAVEAGSRATVMVLVNTPEGKLRSSGSAFCINSSGAFVTNAHVVKEVGIGGQVTLVIGSGDDRDVVTATVENLGEGIDLALLKTSPIAGLKALSLARPEGLALTDEVTTFGFPLGNRLAVGDHPDVAATVGRVTSLRAVDGQVVWVEFDARVLPGNSGGPLLDKRGRVVGVVTANLGDYYKYKDLNLFVPSGVNLAIPLEDLANFLASPRVIFEPPILSYADRSRPVEWIARLVPTAVAPTSRGFDLRAIISTGAGDRRVQQAAESAEGVYKFQVVPIDTARERWSVLTVKFAPEGDTAPAANLPLPAGGGRTGLVAGIASQWVHKTRDLRLRVGSNDLRLSELAYFEATPSPRAVTIRGQSIEGPVAVTETVDEIENGVDPKPQSDLVEKLGKADAVVVRRAGEEELAVTLELARGGKTIAQIKRKVRLAGASPVLSEKSLEWGRLLRQPSWKLERMLAAQQIFDPSRFLVAAKLDSGIKPPAIAIGAARLMRDGNPAMQSTYRLPYRGVALSADGRLFMACDAGKSVDYCYIKPSSGAPLNFLQDVTALAASGDGLRVLVGSADHNVTFRNLNSPGASPKVLSGHVLDVSSVALSADGRLGLSGSRDQTVRIWNLEIAKEERVLRGHDKPVTGVAFVPGDHLALSADEGGSIRLWDAATGQLVRQFGDGNGPVRSVAVAPGGRLCASGHDDGGVRIWDLENGAVIKKLIGHTGTVRALAFPTAVVVVSGGGNPDSSIRVWGIETGAEIACLRDHRGAITGLAAASDGQLFASSSEDGTARIWRLSNLGLGLEEEEADAPLIRELGGTVTDISVGGAGRYLLLSLSNPRRLAIIDVNAADIVKTIPLPEAQVLVAAGAEMAVLVRTDTNVLERWNLATLQKIGEQKLAFPGRIQSIGMGSNTTGPLLAVWVPDPAVSGIPDDPGWGFAFLLIDPTTARPLIVPRFRVATGMFHEMPAPSAFLTLAHWWNRARPASLRVSKPASPGGRGRSLTSSRPGSAAATYREPAILTPRTTYASADGRAFAVVAAAGLLVSIDQEHVDARSLFTPTVTYPLDLGERAPLADADRIAERSTRLLYPFSQRDVTRHGDTSIVPTIDPRFRLRIDLPDRSRGLSIEIQDCKERRLFSFHDFPEMNDLNQDTATSHIPLTPSADPLVNKRFHFVPSAKLLVTIPRTGGRVFFRRLDVDGLMSAIRTAGNVSPILEHSSPASLATSMTHSSAAALADSNAAQPPRATAVAAVAGIPTSATDSREPSVPAQPRDPVDRIIVALVALAGLAVVVRLGVRLVNVRHQSQPMELHVNHEVKGMRTTGVRIRQAVSATLLVALASLAFFELKAYRDVHNAVRLVDSRLFDTTRKPPTRVEVESIIGRPPVSSEVVRKAGSLSVRATYQWFSLLRTHVVTVFYKQDSSQTLLRLASETGD